MGGAPSKKTESKTTEDDAPATATSETPKRTVLVISDSPMGDYSASKTVTKAFLAALQDSDASVVIENLDLVATPPPEYNATSVKAKFAKIQGKEIEGEVKDNWEVTKALIDQFKNADAVVIATAMWNYGITFRLKQYFDNIVQPHLLFSAEDFKGLVTGKPALLIASSGTSRNTDHQIPYLKGILGFVGFTDIRTFVIEGTADQAGLPALLKAKTEEVAKLAKGFTFDASASIAPSTAAEPTSKPNPESFKIGGAKKVLVVTVSPMGDFSASIGATNKAIAALAETGATFETLDLAASPAPAYTANRVMAKFTTWAGKELEGAVKEEWEATTALITQFKAADAYIFAVPMWNLGIPYNLKKYFDNIVQPHLTFDPTDFSGLVKGKPALIIAASGSGLLGGPLDYSTPYLRTILGFMGIVVDSVFINGTAKPENAPKLIDAGAAQATEILKAALEPCE